MTYGRQWPACRLSLSSVLRSTHFHALSGCALLIAAAGCQDISRSHMDHYIATVRSAAQILPEAAEIERLYGDADHFITHFGREFPGNKKQWNTEVYFGGRYSLTMQVDVSIDYENSRVSQVLGSPIFYLVEYHQIDALPDGRFMAHSGNGKVFTREEWKTFYKSHGEFSSLGLTQNSQHTKNFAKFVAAVRKDSVAVSLLTQ